MNLTLKSKQLLRFIAVMATVLIMTVSSVILGLSVVWNQYDFKILDLFYRQAVKNGHGPKQSPLVTIVTISDATYDYFGNSTLDRKFVAKVNEALSRLDVAGCAYDLIFARSADADSDLRLAESIEKLGSVCLPIGLTYADTPSPFRWEKRRSFDEFRSKSLRKPIEQGQSRPYYGTKALMQSDRFSEVARSFGHVSVLSDPDGVDRHAIMLLKVGQDYFPTLSLALFLDYVKVPFEKVVVEWGRRIIIPTLEGSGLEQDVVIPIDDRGRTFIPFPQNWKSSFVKIESVALLKFVESENLLGNLIEMFEGRLVLIGDISTGVSDLGQTPLASHEPLILVHASLLNGMLTNSFYDQWTSNHVLALIWLAGTLLGLAACLRSSWALYGSGIAVSAGIAGLTWLEFIHFHLVPIATVGGSVLIFFFGLVAAVELAVGKERSFIRNAFSRYVPEMVVDALISNPQMLKLSGEERIITVLFCDLADFTTISENLPPARLVHLLNQYLTEMTAIILTHGGIIDKFEGDAIMAEFGAPLPMPDHAERAVRAGLEMQKRLQDLRPIWRNNDLPELQCRVGINTGQMIIGNMGSDQVFDYTVIGDAVNIASRLEGANKYYNTHLIISEYTRQALPPDGFRTRVLDLIKVKGKSKPVKVYEVYGEVCSPLTPEDERYYVTYQEAMELYFERHFDRAGEKFRAALNIRPDDPASNEMLNRIRNLQGQDLPPEWDGSISLAGK
jgi:adenylate cyclase